MNNTPPLRLALLGLMVVGLFAALFARLWYLQVVVEEEFQAEAQNNLFRTVYVGAPRGRVLDRTGNVLIDNRLVNEVVIDKFSLFEALPRESERYEFAVKLAREISAAGRLVKAVDIEEALADQRYNDFDRVPIATDVPEVFSILIGEREDDFPGVRVRKTTVRFYPYGARASHLLGYVGAINADQFAALRTSPKLYQRTDVIGKQGVEAGLEEILRGTPGVEVIEVDSLGNRIRTVDSSDPEPGNDVRLTIDINLQALVEDQLAEGVRQARARIDESGDDDEVVENFKAPGGSMVLLDPDGSRILAMASFPSYDQRQFLQGISQRDFNILRNDINAPLLDRSIQASYPPGSTFKLVTAYAALDSGLLGNRGFLGRTSFLQDKGIWRIPGDCFGAGCAIENAGQKPLGDVDLRLAITESSNVYFGQLGFQFQVRQGFKSQQLLDTARDFGFGEFTDAVYESAAGSLPEPNTAGDAANLAVGQGAMIATPLQMANSYAVIANRGSVFLPMLAEEAIDPATGDVVIDFEPRLEKELHMPDEFYEPLIRGLQGVVADEKGTAQEAFQNFPLNRFQVLGKTGTIEVAGKQDNAAFAAFGPWPNPQYVAVAYIEQAGLGGDAAAPVVARVMRRIADKDIDIVPTEADVDDLVSEAEAAEEERLRTEREAELAAEREAETDESDGPGFEVLVPGGDAPGEPSEPSEPGAESDGSEPAAAEVPG